MNILGFIPARGGSKRIPRKNIKFFLGKPIISYPIKYLQELGITPVVSTEDDEIAYTASSFGAEIALRPKGLADDKTGTIDVLIDYLEKTKTSPEFSLIVYATAVFAKPNILRSAFELIKKGNGVFPMVKYSYPPQRAVKIQGGLVRMVDENLYNRNTQDFEPIYHDVGQFYLLRTKDLLKEKKLFLSRSIPLILKESEIQDIDNEEDWISAEIKYQMISQRRRHPSRHVL